jgi:hypothetical protein
MPCRSSPTTVAQTLCPFFANALTRLRKLRPQQRLHRIAKRPRLDQALEIGLESGVRDALALASCARLADPPERSRNVVVDVREPVIDRRSCQPTDAGHQADPAATQRLRFQRNKAPTTLFIQNGGHLAIAPTCGMRLGRIFMTSRIPLRSSPGRRARQASVALESF